MPRSASGKASLNQGAADARAPVAVRHGEMVEKSPAAVASAQHRADEHAVLLRDKAQSGVARQELDDVPLFVRFAQPDSLHALPEGIRRLVVGDCELTQRHAHAVGVSGSSGLVKYGFAR